MKTMLSVLALVVFALAGCGADDTGGGNVNTGVGNPTPGDGTGVKLGALVVIHAYAPEGLVGDFAFDENSTDPQYVFCKDVSDCEVTWNPVTFALMPRVPCLKGDSNCMNGFGVLGKDLVAGFTCPGHAFVPLKVNATTVGTDKPYEVRWDFAGAWGLAPNGMYLAASDGKTKIEISTAYDEKLDRIVIKGMWTKAIVDGMNISGKGQSSTLTGTISSDLKTISYRVNAEGSDYSFDDTLTLIE